MLAHERTNTREVEKAVSDNGTTGLGRPSVFASLTVSDPSAAAHF